MAALPQLKPILPYLRRAEELDKHQPIVAYYCRLYAVQEGLKLRTAIPKPDSDKITAFILDQMTLLETQKKSIALENGAQDMENFALDVFARADEEDRSGNITKATANKFYVASLFMDVLQQFGDLQIDIAEKRRYAKWKAADITKCLQQGIAPKPGAPGEEVDVQPQSMSSPGPAAFTGIPSPPQTQSQIPPSSIPPHMPHDNMATDFSGASPALNLGQLSHFAGSNMSPPSTSGSIPTGTIAPEILPSPPMQPLIPPAHYSPPSSFTAPIAPSPVKPSTYHTPTPTQSPPATHVQAGDKRPSTRAILDAQKHAQAAVSALQFKDIASALSELKSALRMLEQ
eukprot:GILK01002446.1.p1 GENE.GILK01002446.1~~GILK01002446.1.p1  ORF type:complete len:358 (-),score=51.13 GILK01002446.1:267-1295(-)